jgi:quercetin dioxygenase-like cupin family protein
MAEHHFRTAFVALFLIGAIALPTGSNAQDKEVAPAGERTELKRGDLDGVNGMEIIVATTEYKPGTFVRRHIHHGNEAFYVLEGAMIEPLGSPPRMVQTGAANIYPRDLPHAGFKVVGDKPLKLLTVHIVDKGKPLSVEPNESAHGSH